MKKEVLPVFITEDGEKFFDEKEATKHEEEILNSKAYRVRYAPDLTETGNLGKVGYIIVQAKWANELWAEDWLYKKFGNRVAFVQGVSPTKNWTLEPIKLNEVAQDKILTVIKK